MRTAWAAIAATVLSAQAQAADPDPLQLLRDSARAVDGAASARVDVVVGTTLVRNDETNEEEMTFRYQTAPNGRFAFYTLAEDENETAKYGYHVAGNGEVMLTAQLGGRRHMIEPDQDGFAAFVRSRASAGIGSGLGGIALAFLHPAAMEDLINSVEQSEYLGEVEIDGEKLLHARYTVQGGITSDVWFKAEGVPLVRSIRPDVLSTPGVQQMAARFEKFDYQLSFRFEDWNTEADLTAEDVPVVEPKNSLLMASLYERPAPGPHPLLGKEAPTFELATPEGEKAGLEKANGESVALLEFWSINCPACVQAMPELEKLADKYADKGLKYYAVNIGESPDDIKAFLESKGLEPTVVIDTDQEVSTAYGVSPIPLIVLVGPDGRVQAIQEGFAPSTPAKLTEKIDATLAGEDVAEATLEADRLRKKKQLAERERLKSLLDG